MHTKCERLLSKSLTTLEVITYYLVVHTGPVSLSSETPPTRGAEQQEKDDCQLFGQT